MKSLVLCGLVPCGLLLLAACSKSGDSDHSRAPAPTASPTRTAGPAAVPIDACSLLTKAEVEAAIGRPVAEPRKKEDANLTNCEYGDPERPPFPTVLWLSVTTSPDETEAKKDHEMNRLLVAANLEPMSAVGDDAFWNGQVKGLWVLKGKYQFSIHKAPDSNAAKRLALKALDRLPRH